MHLNRDKTGTRFTGSTKGSFSSCQGQAATGDVLRVQITVTRASPRNGLWAVDQWAGSATLDESPQSPCATETFNLALRSS
jgi:hypothetical protein